MARGGTVGIQKPEIKLVAKKKRSTTTVVAKKVKEPVKPHIFVATPMYGGMCTGYFCNSLINMTNVMKNVGWDMSFSSMFNESLIQRGRNALVHQYLKTPCTHLLFIDADIKFDANDIPLMVQADKDIICGIYPKKEINWHGVEQAVKQGEPCGLRRCSHCACG